MLPVKLVNALLKVTKGLKDSGRPVLGLIEAQNGVVTATDGHRLINIEDPDCGNGYYSYDSVTKAVKIAGVDKLKEMNISSAMMEIPEWQYPHWEQIVPTDLGGCRKVAFRAEYLKEMCEMAIASGSPIIEMHIPKYKFKYDGELHDHCTSPVMCFWKVGELVGRGLLMSVEIRNGFIQWKNTLKSGKPVPKKREKVAA
jgi:hypothetical protein